MKTREEKLAAIEAAMVRWIRRQGRAATELAKLQRKKQRLLKAPVNRPSEEVIVPHVKQVETDHLNEQAFAKLATMRKALKKSGLAAGEGLPLACPDPVFAGAPVHEAVDKIPAFLDRGNPVVAEEMTAARKKAEAEQRKKMPLSGKAALDAIKGTRKKK